MDCFKEISTECQEERDIDDQPIYLDAPVTVAESSLLLMAFAVRHKLSGIALEDLLELIHFHCPKPNKCITELKVFTFIMILIYSIKGLNPGVTVTNVIV